MDDVIEFRVKGKDMERGTVKRQGNGCHIYLPKGWKDKQVVVILVE